MAEPLFLTDNQRRQLNDIYIGIVKKYKNNATESMLLDTVPNISYEEADTLAQFELDEKRAKILRDYNDSVDNINDNASRRGLANSSLVLKQLEKAYQKKQDAIAALDNKQDKLAKKIVADNQKLLLSVEKEKAASKSRSLRDFVAVSKMKNSVPVNVQTLIDDELYSAYLGWLLQYPIATAYSYFTDNTLFIVNMGYTKWQQLQTELSGRNEVQ